MDYKNIKIEYRDTSEKFRAAADEIISYLVENLLVLNAIEEECSQLNEYLRRGIHMKGMPRTSEGIWDLYKKRYGEAISAFCTDELIARGYAQRMNGMRRVIAPDGTLLEEKIYGRYYYLKDGCEFAVTMKSNKRIMIEVFFVNNDRLNRWHKFTLANTDKWRLTDVKFKYHEEDKWVKGWV